MKRTLSEEFIAEFQIETNQNISEIKEKIKKIKSIKKSLNSVNFFEKIDIGYFNLECLNLEFPLNIAAISLKIRINENFWGKVIGVHIFAAIFNYSNFKTINNIVPISSFKLLQEDQEIEDDIIYLKSYQQLIEALEELIEIEKIDILITDIPVIITKSEIRTPSRNKEPDYYKIWAEFNDRLKNFWNNTSKKLYPMNKKGIILISLSKKNAPNLLKLEDSEIFKNNFYDFNKLVKIFKNFNNKFYLLKVCSSLLNLNHRTTCFPLLDVLSREWEPKIFKTFGVLSFFFKPFKNVWKINLLGSYKDWNMEQTNTICVLLNNLGLKEKNASVPFPLWYAKKMANFSKKYLDYYRKRIDEEIKNEFR